MGERSAVVSILKLAKEIHDQFDGEARPDWLADVWQWRKNYQHDDQWFLQIIALKKLRPMVWDTEYRLFANMSCSDHQLPANRDFDISGGECLTRPDGFKPSILHFSGRQCETHRHLWMKAMK